MVTVPSHPLKFEENSFIQKVQSFVTDRIHIFQVLVSFHIAVDRCPFRLKYPFGITDEFVSHIQNTGNMGYYNNVSIILMMWFDRSMTWHDMTRHDMTLYYIISYCIILLNI